MSWFRRLVRRFGRRLVDWADGGRRIHLCRTWVEGDGMFQSPSHRYHAVEMKLGDSCGMCGHVEVRA